MGLAEKIRYFAFCKAYREGRVCRKESMEIVSEGESRAEFSESGCIIRLRPLADGIGETGKEFSDRRVLADSMAEISFPAGSRLPVSAGLEIRISGWKRENYVFMPAAVYNGNRFESVKIPYPPFYRQPGWQGENISGVLGAPERITDILRLDREKKKSEISFLAGDMSTPAMGVCCEGEKEGLLLFGIHKAGERYTGFEVRENLAEEELTLVYSFPGVREGTRYFFGERADGTGFYPHTDKESVEEGELIQPGGTFALPVRILSFGAENVSGLFRIFNEERNCLEPIGPLAHKVPFSEAYRTIKEKYQRENWYCGPEGGYYTVGVNRSTPLNHWQAGWAAA